MSAGHDHEIGAGGLSYPAVKRLLDNEAVRSNFYRPYHINREYDLPYLGGYSKDGDTVYIDRHLPDKLTIHQDGVVKDFNPVFFIADHERLEKALIDALGWNYSRAHQMATAFERRQVLQSGLFWRPYNEKIQLYVKAAEHEKLKKVPPDLDMRPYEAPPANSKLIAHMQKAMGGKQAAKKAKSEVNYENEGHPSSHCGPTKVWPKGDCAHFEPPSSCELVRGSISARGWCKLWKDHAKTT